MLLQEAQADAFERELNLLLSDPSKAISMEGISPAVDQLLAEQAKLQYQMLHLKKVRSDKWTNIQVIS